MTQKDDQGRLCGLMKIEDSNHKFNEEGTRYFVLDLKEGKLKFYFDLPEVVENFTLVLCCTAFVLSHLCRYESKLFKFRKCYQDCYNYQAVPHPDIIYVE